MIIIILGILIFLINDLEVCINSKNDNEGNYFKKYSNTLKYPTIYSLERRLSKMNISYKSKYCELLKTISFLYVILGLITIGFATYSSIHNNIALQSNSFAILLTDIMDFLFRIWAGMPILILYLLVRKTLRIDEKKDAKLKIEKYCLIEVIRKRRKENDL